jgi:hypothetical protein
VLSLCREAGLVKVGLIAIDGTKLHANASHHANLDYEQLAREILKEAARIDAAEDELYGEQRGDELPEHLRTSEGRRAALADARRTLERDRAKGSTDAEMADGTQSPGVELELDPEAIVAPVQGRRGWEREAQRQLEEHRRVQADPIPRSRSARLLEAERRLAENLAVEREANEAYEHHRATAVTSDGRRFGARPNPYEPPATPPGRINTTDLDSRNVKTPRSYTQGYNAQAVVNEHQIVIAAEVTASSPDFGHLQPMVEATNKELEAIGVTETPGVAVADSGYWHEQQMDNVIGGGTSVLIPPDAGKRATPRRGWTGGRSVQSADGACGHGHRTRAGQRHASGSPRARASRDRPGEGHRGQCTRALSTTTAVPRVTATTADTTVPRSAAPDVRAAYAPAAASSTRAATVAARIAAPSGTMRKR